MNLKIKKMLAEIVKENRLAKGYTQKELADISKISLRSIQRIENGEVVPRMYTIKTLADCLDFSMDFLDEEERNKASRTVWTKERKIIFSAGSGILIFFLAAAYLAQAGTFPETGFEFLMYCAFITSLYTLMLLWVWKSRA